ncbi:importin-11 [Trichonephila clavipes]|nr:importin-11 [Trichonephila clavipes]
MFAIAAISSRQTIVSKYLQKNKGVNWNGLTVDDFVVVVCVFGSVVEACVKYNGSVDMRLLPLRSPRILSGSDVPSIAAPFPPSDEGGESWKFSLRPCTEVFFLTCFRQFRNLLTPLVVEITKNVQNNSSRDLLGILKKEAIYNAVGLAAFDLYDEVDFDNWFTNILIPELRIKDPGYHIIRRRVIWLIGQWVGVKMSPEMRPLLYEVILQLLGSDENLIVRLAASNALKVSIDDFEFRVEQFLPVSI